jgi:hypothetical protein
MILSPVLVTKMVFELVIEFINHSQVVTAINYNTVPDFYTTKHSTLIYSVCLHCSSRVYHTGTIQVSLNHFQYHSTTVYLKSSNHTSDLLQPRTTEYSLELRTSLIILTADIILSHSPGNSLHSSGTSKLHHSTEN